MVIKAIGIDLAKSVFSLYGIDDHGKCVLRKTVKRHRRCSLYVLVTVFTPPNNHDFASSLCCSRTRNHAK